MSAAAPKTRRGPVPIETPTGEEGQLLVARQRNGPDIQLMALVEGSRPTFYEMTREAAASLHAQLGEALATRPGEPDPPSIIAH
jgi:hypothetical protein